MERPSRLIVAAALILSSIPAPAWAQLAASAAGRNSSTAGSGTFGAAAVPLGRTMGATAIPTYAPTLPVGLPLAGSVLPAPGLRTANGPISGLAAPAADAPVEKPSAGMLVEARLGPAQALLDETRTRDLADMPATGASQAASRLQDALQGITPEPAEPLDIADAGLPAPNASGVQGGLERGLAAAPDAAASTLPPAPDAPTPAKVGRWRFRLARALVAPVARVVLRFSVRGPDSLPSSGGALIVANHVSWLDAALMSYAAGRPVRFLAPRSLSGAGPAGWLLRAMGAIPADLSAAGMPDPAALGSARAALAAGELVAVFPEGPPGRTASLGAFDRGFESVAAGLGAPVIPAHIDGFRGSGKPVLMRFGAPLAGLSAQAGREAVQELGARNMGERVESSAETLPRAFLRSAKSHWGRLAAADSTGKKTSFGQALTGTVLLARLLRSRLGAERHVGVLLPPSVGGLLANTALGALGRVPVNLNYTAGADAQAYATRKAGIRTVVTSRLFMEKLQEKLGRKVELPASFVYLEDLLSQVTTPRRVLTFLALRLLPRAVISALFFRRADRSLRDTGVILFTSGSSGMPKGVELTHLNIQSNLEMVRALFGFSPEDRVLGALPFFHSFGLTVTLWLPLLTGFAGVYHNHPLDFDPLAKLAKAYSPTLLLGTPTFLAGYAKKIPAEAFSSLRLVIAGAEKLRPETADAFQAKFGVRPLEGYGATELSPIATVNTPDGPGQSGTKPGSVGRPLPGEAVRVVDPETGAPLPYGREGMLLVRGPNVMKGYLDDPRKTAETMKDGWYVTGDIARIDPDGFVTLAGRLSRFSKIAGEMVSHVAVEDKLHQAAGLSDQVFVVAGVPDAARGERLVVLYAGWEGDVNALLAKAKDAGLPRLWTPSASDFHRVDAIPVLGSGKLDLKAVNDLARSL